jgi:AcrR family transcriptional regulator
MARRPKDDPNAPDLDRPRIVAAAIELIDRDGLDTFSLRALARHLGAGNMSLYYYVKDREELLALVLDEILGTVDLDRLPPRPIPALRTLSTRFVAAFTAHPETIPLLTIQPVLTIGPHGADVFDRFVGLLRQTGLPDRTVADATVVLIEYLCGHLIGHLPQVRGSGGIADGAIVDDVLAALPEHLAPNIRAIAPALRRAVDSFSASPGIELILAGLTAGADRDREP